MVANPPAVLDTPVDNVGQRYLAIRIKWLWNLAVPDALTHTAGPFMTTTKVVRVTPSFGLYISVTLTGAAGNRGGIVMGNGVYQDLYVDPGDSMNVVGIQGMAAGMYASILELN